MAPISPKALQWFGMNLGSGDSVNIVAVEKVATTSPSSFTATFNRTNFNVVRVGIDYKFGQ
jgi:hypothetical protein